MAMPVQSLRVINNPVSCRKHPYKNLGVSPPASGRSHVKRLIEWANTIQHISAESHIDPSAGNPSFKGVAVGPIKHHALEPPPKSPKTLKPLLCLGFQFQRHGQTRNTKN